MGCCSSEPYSPPVTVASSHNVYPAPMLSADTAYKWMHRVAGQPLPQGAVVGGRDIDGTQIYVGRALHDGDMIPAKVIPEKDVAYVAHGGQEHAKHSFEVRTGISLFFSSFFRSSMLHCVQLVCRMTS